MTEVVNSMLGVFEMTEKFFNLEEEKQDRIINAAMKEFSNRGYAQASTNEIVKQAGISKGLIFHYFQNKQGLFLFLYDYAMEKMMSEIGSRMDWEERDIFQMYRQVIEVKLRLCRVYPDMFNFLRAAYVDEASEAASILEERNHHFIKEWQGRMFANLDDSKFKEGIDVQRAIHILVWSMEGYSHSQFEKIKSMPLEEMDLDAMMVEIDIYLEMLKQAFYR